MASDSYGIILKVSDGAASAMTAIAEVTSITVPAPETAQYEITHLLSANKRREYNPGWGILSEWGFECNFTVEEYARIKALQDVTHAWSVTFPGETDLVEFSSFVSKVELSELSTADEPIKIKVSAKVSGPVT